MNDFIFNFIFNELKDRTFSSSTQFRIVLEKKYGIKDIETGTRLWTTISNYQIKKYGQSINPQNWVDLSKETLRRKGRQRRAELHRKKRR